MNLKTFKAGEEGLAAANKFINEVIILKLHVSESGDITVNYKLPGEKIAQIEKIEAMEVTAFNILEKIKTVGKVRYQLEMDIFTAEMDLENSESKLIHLKEELQKHKGNSDKLRMIHEEEKMEERKAKMCKESIELKRIELVNAENRLQALLNEK